LKNSFQFLLTLLLAVVLWLIYNLAQPYSSLVNVIVVAESNIEGRSTVSSSDATVCAQVNTSGFNLLSLNIRGRNPQRIKIAVEDFVYSGEGDTYILPSSSLYKYTKLIFGEDVNLETFVSGQLEFNFTRENHRKVPVRAVRNLSFRPQYMAVKEMSIVPDSVVIYGEPSRIDGIEAVLTSTITHTDVHVNIHGTARLITPSGTRLSAERTIYSQEVSRYVEIPSQASVEVRGVPSNVDFFVLPSVVDVLYKCEFPLSGDPAGTRFWVDYKEFESSIGGTCLIHIENVPSGVLEIKLDPEVCECFVQSPTK